MTVGGTETSLYLYRHIGRPESEPIGNSHFLRYKVTRGHESRRFGDRRCLRGEGFTHTPRVRRRRLKVRSKLTVSTCRVPLKVVQGQWTYWGRDRGSVRNLYSEGNVVSLDTVGVGGGPFRRLVWPRRESTWFRTIGLREKGTEGK